jgi:CheY-like chemotaxis protein
MHMPVMDGLEATHLMREHEKTNPNNDPRHLRIPIIALSGNAMKEQVEEALQKSSTENDA